MRDEIIPRCVEHGIRTFISGHEHNFQSIDSEDAGTRVKCIVPGGSGQFRSGKPEKATNGHVECWGGNTETHFLIATITGPSMKIEAVTASGKALSLFNRQGDEVTRPIEVSLTG